MEKLVLSVYSGSVWKRFKNKPRRPQIEEEENFSTQKEGALDHVLAMEDTWTR